MISTVTLLPITILGLVARISTDHMPTIQQVNALANSKIAKALRSISFGTKHFLAQYPENDEFQSTCQKSSNTNTTYVCETSISKIEFHEYVVYRLSVTLIKRNKAIRLEDLRFNVVYTLTEDGNLRLNETSSYFAEVCGIPSGSFLYNCTSLFDFLQQKVVDV